MGISPTLNVLPITLSKSSAAKREDSLPTLGTNRCPMASMSIIGPTRMVAWRPSKISVLLIVERLLALF
uniref:Uncharacterized protein n=1 Tax=Cannabis sativa TaxID=3483 RepID=A0A803Q5X7_CANSA